MAAGLIVAPLLVPQMALVGHFNPLHAATGCAVSLAAILIATVVFYRYGYASRAYRWMWGIETTAVNLTFLSLAFAGKGAAPWFWVLVLVQVFLIALEGSFSKWPLIMYAIFPALAAVGHVVIHRAPVAAVWALLFGGCAVVMCVELQRIGRRLSAMVVEREELLHELVERRASDERARIARDLHDGLAAELTAMAWRVESMEKVMPEPTAQAALGGLVDRVQLSIDELRAIVWALRSPAQGWQEVVDYLRGRCMELCGDAMAFELEEHDEAAAGALVGGPERIAMVRVALEAVRNAARHSKAKTVRVRLHRKDTLSLSVDDDGAGVPAQTKPRPGSGLANMQSRVHALGGEWTFESGVAGTHIHAVLPLGGQHDERTD